MVLEGRDLLGTVSKQPQKHCRWQQKPNSVERQMMEATILKLIFKHFCLDSPSFKSTKSHHLS